MSVKHASHTLATRLIDLVVRACVLFSCWFFGPWGMDTGYEG